MAKFVYIYSGGEMARTDAERDAQMAAWGQWFGNPFGASKTVGTGGSVKDGAGSDLGGYSIVNADSLAAAAELAKGCPIFKNGGKVEVYETIEVM